MATSEILNFNQPHSPKGNSFAAFHVLLPEIKSNIVKSRHDWDLHEPAMWNRVKDLTDEQLVGAIDIERDLVLVRSAPTSYGTIVLGKIRVGGDWSDGEGQGFVHVRIHDPPAEGNEDVKFHSLWTDEGKYNAAGNPTSWRAVQTEETPLEFFHE